jgi:prolyl 4-hydroxylase
MIGELERLAEKGDSDAQLELGRHCESEERTALARGWYARAAKQGNVAGLRALAINLLTRAPIVERDGVAMIRSAAGKGDAEALYVCAMLAAQDIDLNDRWTVASEYLAAAAARGWEIAQTQRAFLGPKISAESAISMCESAQIRVLFDSPRIGAIESFASPEICAWLIERARPRVARAQVYDAATGGGRVEGARTNSAIGFNIAQTDMILMLLRERIAATTRMAKVSLETSSILHYAPGESFEPHFDFLDPAVPAYARDIRANGQRVATFLIYLNEDYEGGETDFPDLGWRHKGRKGDALLFWNVMTSGAPDIRARHAGLPPTSGEKWLFSQWLRQRPNRQGG